MNTCTHRGNNYYSPWPAYSVFVPNGGTEISDDVRYLTHKNATYYHTNDWNANFWNVWKEKNPE